MDHTPYKGNIFHKMDCLDIPDVSIQSIRPVLGLVRQPAADVIDGQAAKPVRQRRDQLPPVIRPVRIAMHHHHRRARQHSGRRAPIWRGTEPS